MRKAMLFALVLLLAATAVFAQNRANTPTSSPTAAISQSLFNEVSDQYLNVLLYGQVQYPVFMFKFQTSQDPDPTDPDVYLNPGAYLQDYEAGMSGRFGPFYIGAFYGFNGGIDGLITPAVPGPMVSVVQARDDTLIYDVDAQTIVGKTSHATSQTNYSNNHYNNPVAFFGMKLGTMQLGVKDSLYLIDKSAFGTYNTAGTLSTSTVDTVYEIQTVEGARTEVPITVNATEYAIGKQGESTFGNDLEAGISMPLAIPVLGTTTLRARLALDVAIADNSDSYASKQQLIQVGAGFTPYTPTLGLPGDELVAINDVDYYAAYRSVSVEKPFTLAPELSGSLEIPLTLFQNKAVANVGLSYSGSFTAYSANLETGAEANLSTGTGTQGHSVTFNPNFSAVTGLLTTTTVETYTYSGQKYSSDAFNTVALPLSIAFTPSKAVRFAFGLAPSVGFGSEKFSFEGGSRTITTFNDGDADAAATDYDDSVTTAVAVSQPYTQTTDNFTFDMDFGSAVQVFLYKDKFRLNLGAGAWTEVVDRTAVKKVYTGFETSTTTEVRADLTTITNASSATLAGNEYARTVTDDTIGTIINYKAGFTYFLNPNMTIDFDMANPRAFNLTATTANGGFFNLANYRVQMTIMLPPSKE